MSTNSLSLIIMTVMSKIFGYVYCTLSMLFA